MSKHTHNGHIWVSLCNADIWKWSSWWWIHLKQNSLNDRLGLILEADNKSKFISCVDEYHLQQLRFDNKAYAFENIFLVDYYGIPYLLQTVYAPLNLW